MHQKSLPSFPGACMFSDRVAHVGNVTSHSAILELNSTDRNEVSVPPRAATRTRGRIVAHTENSTSESGSLELHSIQADRNEVSVPPHADARTRGDVVAHTENSTSAIAGTPHP